MLWRTERHTDRQTDTSNCRAVSSQLKTHCNFFCKRANKRVLVLFRIFSSQLFYLAETTWVGSRVESRATSAYWDIYIALMIKISHFLVSGLQTHSHHPMSGRRKLTPGQGTEEHSHTQPAQGHCLPTHNWWQIFRPEYYSDKTLNSLFIKLSDFS